MNDYITATQEGDITKVIYTGSEGDNEEDWARFSKSKINLHYVGLDKSHRWVVTNVLCDIESKMKYTHEDFASIGVVSMINTNEALFLELEKLL